MTEESLDKQLAAARRVTPSYGPARQQQLIWQVRRGLAERLKLERTARALAVGGLVLAAGATFVASRVLRPAAAPSPLHVAAAAPQLANGSALELADGSEITPDTAQTELRQTLDTPTEADFELKSGAAAFEVTPRSTRAFFVRSGDVTVRVTGTRFRVERRPLESGERTVVSVQRGSVVVSWSGGSQVLHVGEGGMFPPEPAVASVGVALVAGASADTGGNAASAATTPNNPQSSAEALFASADRERAAGQPTRAEQDLRALVERFPRDARAPLAAFTRGRLLLESLGRPRDAAAAFARARAGSSPKSALAEDALAREVEALRAAGDASLAQRRAALYLKLYPNGLRRAQMGSLE